jgi:LysM repeat protein
MKFLSGAALLFFILFFSFSTVSAGHVFLPDSIGAETINGQMYVLHKVDAGQTLYAVMRRYQASIKAIKDANPGMSDQLRTDQVIRVPYTAPKRSVAKEESKKKDEKKADSPSSAASSSGIHRVEAGQTLYSIAVKYGVLMADIRKWNALTSDNVPLGENLIVSEKAYLEANKNTVATTSPDSVRTKTVNVPRKSQPERVPLPPTPAGKRMTESGLAELIETEASSSKYLALHHSAPVGTLMQVKNAFNQETIWVKVVGRIPDTSVNEDIVIKLSTRAFEKLSPNSRRFRAEISYISAN